MMEQRADQLLHALINALGEQTWGGAMAKAQRLMRQSQVPNGYLGPRLHDPSNPCCPMNADPRNESCGC